MARIASLFSCLQLTVTDKTVSFIDSYVLMVVLLCDFQCPDQTDSVSLLHCSFVLIGQHIYKSSIFSAYLLSNQSSESKK